MTSVKISHNSGDTLIFKIAEIAAGSEEVILFTDRECARIETNVGIFGSAGGARRCLTSLPLQFAALSSEQPSCVYDPALFGSTTQ